MNGIVSLLDESSDRIVRGIWCDLADTLNLTGIQVTPLPHFSYHVASGYNDAALDTLLREQAEGMEPFRARTAGLGVFTEGALVLYIPVVRTRALSRLHERLWHAVTPHSTNAVHYYHPETWVPHITLAHGDLSAANLPDVLRLLGTGSFDWEIDIDNFATIYAGLEQHQLRQRYTFGAPRLAA